MLGSLALLGIFFGYPAYFLNLGLLIYLGWHLFNLYRLYRWLNARKLKPPDAPGIWGVVFSQFYRLQQRNRKRKRKLGNMLKRFRESTEAIPDAAVVLNADFEIEWFNRAASEYLGLHPQRDANMPIANLMRDPRFNAYLTHQSKDQDQSIQLTSPIDPQRILRVHLIPYARRSHLLIARDISRLHHLEQIRRDFVANVSHELRTPLTVLNGFLETMYDADDECSRIWQRPLTLMGQQTARMQRIVHDLLLLSRLESDEPNGEGKPIDVPVLLADIQEDAQALSNEQHRFEMDIDNGLCLCGYEEELHSAFSNLVFNAVRYTPTDGTIRLRWFDDDEGVHFAVEDTGEGIAAAHIPRLTERFYRVDVARSRNQGGTGLGLAIVKHVLNRHHGQLKVKSSLGEGSTFQCDFPAKLGIRNDDDIEMAAHCQESWQGLEYHNHNEKT